MTRHEIQHKTKKKRTLFYIHRTNRNKIGNVQVGCLGGVDVSPWTWVLFVFELLRNNKYQVFISETFTYRFGRDAFVALGPCPAPCLSQWTVPPFPPSCHSAGCSKLGVLFQHPNHFGATLTRDEERRRSGGGTSAVTEGSIARSTLLHCLACRFDGMDVIKSLSAVDFRNSPEPHEWMTMTAKWVGLGRRKGTLVNEWVGGWGRGSPAWSTYFTSTCILQCTTSERLVSIHYERDSRGGNTSYLPKRVASG